MLIFINLLKEKLTFKTGFFMKMRLEVGSKLGGKAFTLKWLERDIILYKIFFSFENIDKIEIEWWKQNFYVTRAREYGLG